MYVCVYISLSLYIYIYISKSQKHIASFRPEHAPQELKSSQGRGQIELV